MMKTLFFGTPALAVPFLESLARKTDLRAVVTNPDEPAGRGYALKPSPVKEAAIRLGLPVHQPVNLKEEVFVGAMRAAEAGFALVVAYGKILPASVLQSTRHGFLNVHFSLLPSYRGAAPVQRALINGEKETGVTLFWLDEGMDSGNIFLQKALSITDEENAEEVRQKLVPLGLSLIDEVVSRIEKGDIVRLPQAGPVSRAPVLKKEEGRIDWSRPASAVHNLIRGTVPWPGAYTLFFHQGKKLRLKISRSQVVRSEKPGVPGQIVDLEVEKGPVIKCLENDLLVVNVQPEGKRAMSAWEFWQGARLKIGDKLGI
jgi:methionyl-tRNA formyltransferase